MRYRNIYGVAVLPDIITTNRNLYRFISSYNHIYLSPKIRERLEPLRKELDIADLREYLVNACKFRRCVIVKRDPITLIVVCSKIRYVVDYQTLSILNAEGRSGDYL